MVTFTASCTNNKDKRSTGYAGDDLSGKIEKNYGNKENFITQKLNVDLKKFRELYLY